MQEGQQKGRGSDAFPKSDTNASQTTDIQIRNPSTSDVLPYGLALLPCIREQKAGESAGKGAAGSLLQQDSTV